MQLPAIIEALLTASEAPLPTSELARLVRARCAEIADERADENPDTGEDAGDYSKAENIQSPPNTPDTSTHPSDEEASPDSSELDYLALQKTDDDQIIEAINALNDAYLEANRAFTILERAKGWKIYTTPAYADFVRQLFPGQKPRRLSGPAMETLAVVAYRQPITKSAIEAVRGVSCDGMLQKLLDQELIHIQGRADLPGRPLLYETTELFFEHFGVKSVQDLPNSQELRNVPLPEAPEETEKETPEPSPEKKEPTDTPNNKQLPLAQPTDQPAPEASPQEDYAAPPANATEE